MGLDSQGARPTDTPICSDRGARLLSHPWKHLVLVELEHLFTKTMILQWEKSTHRLKYTEIILILIQQTYSRPRNLIFSTSLKWFILMQTCLIVEFLVEHQYRQCTGNFWQNPKSRSLLHGKLTSSCLSSKVLPNRKPMVKIFKNVYSYIFRNRFSFLVEWSNRYQTSFLGKTHGTTLDTRQQEITYKGGTRWAFNSPGFLPRSI